METARRLRLLCCLAGTIVVVAAAQPVGVLGCHRGILVGRKGKGESG